MTLMEIYLIYLARRLLHLPESLSAAFKDMFLDMVRATLLRNQRDTNNMYKGTFGE